ncbi:MAG: gamma-glutamyltransferase, partial [Candidatus Zixiibacteriota bacterium]
MRRAGLIFTALFALLGCRGLEVARYYERGALATAAPIATRVGEKVFADGGNAFDVAVAVGFTLAVVHPEAGNIGGGGFAVVRHGTSGQVRALDFRETAPLAASERMYLDEQGEVIENSSLVGAKAAGVPGTVAGLHELWRQYGSVPWEKLVGIAAALADSGFVVDDYLARSLEAYSGDLQVFEETAELFCPEGRSPRSGQRLSQKDLARTLYLIAAEGPGAFYTGEIADSIEQCMLGRGGLITREDLSRYRAVWREPVRFRFDSLDVYSMPPPSSGGILLGQILRMLEPYDFSRLSPKSPEYLHLFAEVSRLAYADRSEHLGDPDFYPVPASELLNDSYLEIRRSSISMKRAASSQDVKPGTLPRPSSDQTTHFSVCDSDGNMVALTYTLNSSYGSMLAVRGCGFLLNNEMDDFSIKPGVPNIYGLVGGQANRIQPGKRMLSSMSPTIVLSDGRPLLVLGAPGGGKIITVVAQAIIGLTRFGLSPEETARLPRFHHQWLPDILYLERGGFDDDIRQELTRYGHYVEERS